MADNDGMTHVRVVLSDATGKVLKVLNVVCEDAEDAAGQIHANLERDAKHGELDGCEEVIEVGQ